MIFAIRPKACARPPGMAKCWRPASERVAKGEAEFREWADVKDRLLRQKA